MSHDPALEHPSEGSIYRPIGEVAALLRLQPHVLRFWETKFRQIAPLKRSGGRRYYRREDVRLLFQIRDLLYVEGYTLRGAQKVLQRAAKGGRQVEKSAEKPSKQSVEEIQKTGQEIAQETAQETAPLSHASRAELLRIAQRLEQALAFSAEEQEEQEPQAQEEAQDGKEGAVE